MVHVLSRSEACRVAVHAQWLAQPRPTDLLELVRHLTFLPLDPTNVVAPAADHVAWSRLGSSYEAAERDELVTTQQLIALRGHLRPAEDIALFRADMATWPGRGPLKEWQEHQRDWVEANDHCRLELLDLLDEGGPMSARELPDSCDVPWRSTGWTDGRNVLRLLDLMLQRGEVAVAGQRGRDKLWDLAERVYPDDPVPDPDRARRERDRRLLAALGIVRPTASVLEETDTAEMAGEEAHVDGVRGTWRVDPEALSRARTAPDQPRTVLLSPLDQLVFDRKRMGDLFGFDYQLEMYKPAAQRRFGYFALPVLAGDRLVGKVDATAERDRGVLRVDAVHADDGFEAVTAEAVWRELTDLADWLGLHLEDRT